ncbi:ABC transporter ATP-binding protein [Agromyces sp. G08B096]|uniref:ABC transporter ATP-binding protein n=1 Tax=Agromyces sp. G08B096 TaxID=3156399 RepID=A0AAU7WAQ2_9MICO
MELDETAATATSVDPAPVEAEAPAEAEPAVAAEASAEAEPAVAAQAPAAAEVAVPAAAEPADEASVIAEPAADASVAEAPVAEASVAASDSAVAVIPAPAAKPAQRKKRTLRVAREAPPADAPTVLQVEGLVKRFGPNVAVDQISLDVRAGSFYGVVGPNGAGKTTTLSMVTGLLRPDEGVVRIHGIDAWADPKAAKRATGVLPDRLRLFDRLTGAQLLDYSGTLRGLDHRTVRERSVDLINAFGLEDAVDRLVADYSAGMTKKIALACAMIHSPRLLVLDEPFESVDPVSAANLTEILERYVAGGGTVVLSSHGMDLIERVCDSVAIVVAGRVLAQGTLDEVRQGETLEDRFVELAGGRKAAEGMEWLHSFSD